MTIAVCMLLLQTWHGVLNHHMLMWMLWSRRSGIDGCFDKALMHQSFLNTLMRVAVTRSNMRMWPRWWDWGVCDSCLVASCLEPSRIATMFWRWIEPFQVSLMHRLMKDTYRRILTWRETLIWCVSHMLCHCQWLHLEHQQWGGPAHARVQLILLHHMMTLLWISLSHMFVAAIRIWPARVPWFVSMCHLVILSTMPAARNEHGLSHRCWCTCVLLSSPSFHRTLLLLYSKPQGMPNPWGVVSLVHGSARCSARSQPFHSSLECIYSAVMPSIFGTTCLFHVDWCHVFLIVGQVVG